MFEELEQMAKQEQLIWLKSNFILSDSEAKIRAIKKLIKNGVFVSCQNPKIVLHTINPFFEQTQLSDTEIIALAEWLEKEATKA